MPVPQSIDQRMRVMIWQLAREGFGEKEIAEKLSEIGIDADKTIILECVKRSKKVK